MAIQMREVWVSLTKWVALIAPLLAGLIAVSVVEAKSQERPIRAEYVVRYLDADGDGRLSKTEFTRLAGRITRPSETYDEAFVRIDLDGDGYLSVEEVAKALN